MRNASLWRRLFLALVLTVSARGATAKTSPDPDYWPTNGWRESSPEAQGMDSRTLASALNYAREHGVPVHEMVIVRNGRVVLDAPFFPYRASDLHDIASVTKSVTASLIGIAIAKHQLIGLQQPVLPLLAPGGVANGDPLKERLTLEHFLTMSSGLSCEWDPDERTLEDMQHSTDWIQYTLGRPMAAAPGSTFAYSSPGMHVLSGVISRVSGSSALDFARRELFQPLGIKSAEWPADPHGISHGWGDLHLHARDLAKLGFLWLNGGRWGDRQLLPAGWMAEATRAHIAGTGWASGGSYGYGFWVDARQTLPVFGATGRGGQRIRVTPSQNLIVVLVGRLDVSTVSHFITESIKSDHALPEDAESKALLDSAVAAAARPPQPHAVAVLPPLAATVSGRSFVLDENALGLKSLALSFASRNEAALHLEFGDGRVEERPMGLDGVPRISPNGRFKLPVAVSGSWTGDNTFTFDYDEVANINCYRFHLTFSARQVAVEVEEQTGLVHARFAGKDSAAGP